MSIQFTSLLDRAAYQHLAERKLLPSFSHYDVWLYEHSVAFTVAKMMNMDLLAETKAALQTAMQNGTTYRDFEKRLKPFLMARGWWGEQVMTDPADGVAKTVQLGSTRRLRVIFQTNMATAYAAGRWQRIQAYQDDFPYLKYIPSVAEQKRQSHMAYYNRIWRVGDPIWQTIYPPNGYGCQCTVRQLTEAQALRERGEDIADNPSDFDAQQIANHKKGIIDDGKEHIEWVAFTNPCTRQTVNIPFDITPTFAHNHAKRLDNLIDVAAQKYGSSQAEHIQSSSNDYIADKLVRPHFTHGKPNLTVLNGDEKAQLLVYRYAGFGQQIGINPTGTQDSMEWIQADGKILMFRYTDKGVMIKHITQAELIQAKIAGMKGFLQNNLTQGEIKLLKHQIDEIRAQNYGRADLVDKLAAHIYTTNSGFTLINMSLIKSKGDLSQLSKSKVQLIRALDYFLNIAPKYQGTTTRILGLHGMPDAQAFLNAHKKGNLVRYSNFTSTQKVDGSFGDLADVHLTIRGKSGVDIARLSQFPSENEVLMPRTAVYRVVDIRQHNGRYHIELEEIDPMVDNPEKIIQLSTGKHGSI